MLPLVEIAGLAATVDGHRCSAVADEVAAAWGLPAGAARWRRSSASHVFAVPSAGAFLRFVPAASRPGRALPAVADLMRCWPGVVRPVPPAAGGLVAQVATSRGAVRAVLVQAAPGEPIDLAELTAPQAHAWGAALARLHRDAPPGAAVQLPGPFAVLDAAQVPGGALPGGALAGDPELAAAVGRVRAALAELPRTADTFGVTHGDFELDNLAWAADGSVTAFDLDDAGRSWFAADVAHAVRDLAEPAGHPMLAEFVAGYRCVRDLPDADLARLPLFAAAHAATWLARLPEVLAGAPDDPPWAATLRGKLTAYAARQRALVLAGAPARMHVR